MDKQEEQYNLVQQYLEGSLSALEEAAFEKRLLADAELMEQFQFECDLRDSLQQEALKKSLPGLGHEDFLPGDADAKLTAIVGQASRDWENAKPAGVGFRETNSIPVDSSDKRQGAKVFHIRKWAAISAAACTIIAVGTAVWIFQRKPTNQPNIAVTEGKDSSKTNINKGLVKDITKDTPLINVSEKPGIDLAAIFNHYFRQDDVPDEKPLLLASSLEDFKRGDYKKMEQFDIENIPISRGLDDEEKLNSEKNVRALAYYYKGLAYLEKGNLPKAKKNLSWVADKAQDKYLANKAQWYLALTFLKEGEKDKASQLLTTISRNAKAGAYQKKAIALLSQLNG